jgi:hypothetical protein
MAAPDTSRRPIAWCVQEVSERERPDDGGDEQRLDDRDTATVERGGLENDADDLRGEAEEPDPLREQHEKRRRASDGDGGEAQRRLLPERRGERK